MIDTLIKLIVCVCVCVCVCVLFIHTNVYDFSLPVYLGRKLMSLWMGETRSHELYTAACGLYTCWVTLRALSILYTWLPQGVGVIFSKISEWVLLVSVSQMKSTRCNIFVSNIVRTSLR